MSTPFLVVETGQIRKLVRDLETFASKAMPFAVRESLNRSALAAKNVWAEEMGRKLILRNRYTLGSLRIQKVQGGMDPRRMVSVVGSLAPYMRTQELGGTKRKHGKHGVAIPTMVASGEGRGAPPRQRLVRRPNKLSVIRIQPRVGATRQQRNAVSIRRAMSSGQRYVFLELKDGREGLFRVSGGKRNPRLDMIWNIKGASVRIPPHRTLEPALVRLTPHLPAIHLGALREQAARHRILGY